MEKQESAKFIQYMAKRLKVTSQKELESALESMGPEKIKAAYEEFKQGKGTEEETPEYKNGGALEYIQCLHMLKKGGTVKCGCGNKMQKGGNIQKAFLGALLAGAKGIMAGAKTAGTLAKGASTAMKIGKGLQTAGKVMNAGQQIMGSANKFMAPQTLATSQVPINPQIAPELNPVTTQNTPVLNAQSIPTMTPGKPMYSEDGGKLAKVKKLQAFKGKKSGVTMNKEGGELSFGQAFSQNRKAGAKEFTWKGKRYNTRTKEEEENSPKRTENRLPEQVVTAKKKTNMLPEVTVTAKRTSSPLPEVSVIGHRPSYTTSRDATKVKPSSAELKAKR